MVAIARKERQAMDGALDGVGEVEAASATELPLLRCPLIMPAATRQGDTAVAKVTPKASMSTGIVQEYIEMLFDVKKCDIDELRKATSSRW